MIVGYKKGTTFQRRLRINSINKYSEMETDSNFTIELGQNMDLIMEVSLASVQFHNVFYNLYQTSVKYNTRFQMIVTGTGAGTYSLGVTPGRYTANTLALELAATVNDTLPGTTLTFNLDSITNKMSVYTTTTSTTISIQAPTSNPVGIQGRQAYWPFGLLGFESQMNNIPQSAGSALVATNMPSLNDPSVAYISSAALSPSYAFDEKGTISNIFSPITLSAPYLGLQTWECKQDILCAIRYATPRSLTRIDIKLVDHEGDILDLHGTPINIELLVWANNY